MDDKQIEAGKEYIRQKRREYWQRMPAEQRKERQKAAYNRFWSKMSKEERKQKRLEYAAATAARKAAQSENDDKQSCFDVSSKTSISTKEAVILLEYVKHESTEIGSPLYLAITKGINAIKALEMMLDVFDTHYHSEEDYTK